jgi:predicted ATPase
MRRTTHDIDPTLTPFVGRDSELAALRRLLGAVEGGSPRVALVSGEAGIGKSRMVRELMRISAEQSGRSAMGAAYDDVAAEPFGPMLTCLRALQPAASAETAAAIEAALDRLSARATQQEFQAGDRTALFGRVTDVIAAAARNESLRLLVFEDLPWADASTLALLTHLARRLAGGPVFMLATFRPVERESDALSQFVDSLRREFIAVRITLQPMLADEARALVIEASVGVHSPAPAYADAPRC